MQLDLLPICTNLNESFLIALLMNVFIILIISAVAVFFGRWLSNIKAVRSKDRHHVILGFTTGMLAMLTFGEIFSEALDLPFWGLSFILVGMVLGWLMFKKHNHANTHSDEIGVNKMFRVIGIFIHSVFDGFGLAVIYSISHALFFAGLIAFFAHRVNDGFTGSVILRKKAVSPRVIRNTAVLNAISPMIGVLLFYLLDGLVSYEYAICIGSALAFGFFFSLIRYELVPEILQEEHPVLPTLISVLVGVVAMYTLILIS